MIEFPKIKYFDTSLISDDLIPWRCDETWEEAVKRFNRKRKLENIIKKIKGS